MGFLGFESIRKKKAWPESVVSLLKIVGETFARTLGYQSPGEVLGAIHDISLQLFVNPESYHKTS
jgi:hypothetical protein